MYAESEKIGNVSVPRRVLLECFTMCSQHQHPSMCHLMETTRCEQIEGEGR